MTPLSNVVKVMGARSARSALASAGAGLAAILLGLWMVWTSETHRWGGFIESLATVLLGGAALAIGGYLFHGAGIASRPVSGHEIDDAEPSVIADSDMPWEQDAGQKAQAGVLSVLPWLAAFTLCAAGAIFIVQGMLRMSVIHSVAEAQPFTGFFMTVLGGVLCGAGGFVLKMFRSALH